MNTYERFFYWLRGFLTDKIEISKEELENIKKQMEGSDLPPHIINGRYEPSQCRYPDDCGLPQTWHGILPPTCNKCGFTASNFEITC